MRLTIRAHFDGKVIVPDEPVELPVDQPLNVQLDVASGSESANTESDSAIGRFLSHAVQGANIPDSSLGREDLYDDRT